jgi:hypothetical protein
VARVLAIIEMGGFPLNLAALRAAGHVVEFAASVRKALPLLKSFRPEALLAEMIVTPDFRDRVSNLDTLFTQVQAQCPAARVIVLHEPGHEAALGRLRARFAIAAALTIPFSQDALAATLKEHGTIPPHEPG